MKSAIIISIMVGLFPELEPVLWRVDVPHFCAGVRVLNNRVVDAAPILKWAIGKDIEAVRLWAVRKGGTCLPC